MKLTSIEIQPYNSSEIAILSFRDPTSLNPYNVKSISGLDAPAITPKYYPGKQGSNLYSMSLENREVVFSIGLNPDFSSDEGYSDLRDSLYRIISSSRTGLVQIVFKNGTNVIATVRGFVTKFESALFEKDQTVQLTVTCKDPMLQDPNTTSVSTITLNSDPGFITIVDNVSTAPHGFAFTFKLESATSFIQINPSGDPDWVFRLEPVGGFLSNDRISLSSEYGNKYVERYRPSTSETIQLADTIATGSIWPLIFPGTNQFGIGMNVPGALEWLSLSHHLTYWGV